MISRIDAIGIIANHVESDDLMISTTGMISRELFVTEDRSRNFYMLGSMGLASAFGLGLALLNPDQGVVVLEGDGSALMSMGTLALITSESPPNLVHIVLDNESYESTGGQATITNQIDLSLIAESSGYQHVVRADDGDQLTAALAKCRSTSGPHFILAKVGVASVEGISRVTHTPIEIRDRFRSTVKNNFSA